MKAFHWILLSVFCLTTWSGCNRSVSVDKMDYGILSEADIDELIETGLKAWRIPGAIAGGAACMHCHAPDGIDLAFMNYSDFTIRRRGAEHAAPGIETLNASKLEDIVNMIRALQVKHNVNPVDPKETIPFQPGGALLKGSSNQEKDASFGIYLKESGFRFAAIPIDGDAEARLQAEELARIDLAEMLTGIELNPWSEDPYYSNSIRVLGDWLPLTPVKPTNVYIWNENQISYTANPGLQELAQLIATGTNHSFQPASVYLRELSQLKYKALLIAQHRFRNSPQKNDKIGISIGNILYELNRIDPAIGNPFWEIGQFFQRLEGIELLELSENLNRRLESGDTDDLVLPWYWLGWMADPSFESTNCDASNGCLNRILEHLKKEEMHFHRLFVLAKTFTETKKIDESHHSTHLWFSNDLPVFDDSGIQELYELILNNINSIYKYGTK